MARGLRPVTSSPRKATLPALSFSTPKQARATSDLPEPTRPASPTTSPARTWIDTSRHGAVRRREILDIQQHLAGIAADLGEDLGDHPAGHQLDQPGLRHLLHPEGRDMPAVAQHRDAVADALDLGHAVGDVDDADALALGLLDQAEQPLGLALGQGGRGLVEDEHRQLGAEGLGDLHHLLLGAGEIGHPHPRLQGKAEALDDLARLGMHGPLVEQACSISSAPRNRFSSTVSWGTSENSWKTALMPSWRA